MKPTCSLTLLLPLAVRQSGSHPCCSVWPIPNDPAMWVPRSKFDIYRKRGRTLSSRRRRTANVRTRAPMPCTHAHWHDAHMECWKARSPQEAAHSPQHFFFSRQFCHPRCSDGSRARVHRRPSALLVVSDGSQHSPSAATRHRVDARGAFLFRRQGSLIHAWGARLPQTHIAAGGGRTP